MGTEVLRPQEFWADRFRPLPPPIRRRSHARSHRRPSLPRLERPDGRRKSPSPSPSTSTSPSPLPSPPPLFSPISSPSPSSSRSPSPSTSPQPRELISARIPRRSFSVDELQTHYNNKFGAPTPHTGRGVRIMMRRRQSLDTIDATIMQRDMNCVTRGGFMKKKYMYEDDVYAGSAFFVSPSPSSLPLPSFFNNNSSSKPASAAMKNDQFRDSATRDLRRLLRLE